MPTEISRSTMADIARLLPARSESSDWGRLLWRFDRHRRVLFSRLVLFGFVYPGRRLHIPHWLMRELIQRLSMEMQALSSDRDVCQGTLLFWGQYLDHIEHGDYKDARHRPLTSAVASLPERYRSPAVNPHGPCSEQPHADQDGTDGKETMEPCECDDAPRCGGMHCTVRRHA